MAGLTIKISADTQSAITQFNELGNSQNRFVKSLEDADKALGKANLDAFADKQALARAAITATRGETEALSSSVKAYQNKIESLIKQGISPENEEVQKLVKEEERLKKELEDTAAAHKLQENAAKGAAVALAAIAAATGAAIAGSVKAAAKVEDMRAAYTTLLGSQEKAAELVKRINTEAATTPFEIENISASMNKLLPLFKGDSDAAVKTFRMIGDTAGGNAQKLATLTDAYAKVQMKGKTSMMELNQISNAGVPIFDVLSQKFGVTTAELFEMSKNGDITAEHLTDAFKIMTSEGGVFFNGMENSSDTFNMRLLGLKENIGLVAAEIGAKFLPGLKDILGAALDAVTAFSEWIGEGDNLDMLLATLGYTLAGVTAGLAAFLVVSKGHTVVTAMTVAVKALTGALAANPISAVAIAVTTVAVPAFIALAKHIDETKNRARELNKEFEKEKNIHSEAAGLLEGLNDEKTLDAETTDKLIKLYPELTGKIREYGTTVGQVKKDVNELSTEQQINYINGLTQAYTDETNAIRAQIEKIAAAQKSLNGTRQESDLYTVRQGNLAALEKDLEKMKLHAEETSLSISKAYESFEAMGTGHIPKITGAGEAGEEDGDEYVKSYVKTLNDKLKNVTLTPKQDYAQDIADFEAYLNRMADMENLKGDARIAAIKSQEQRIREEAELTAEEREALADAVTAAQKKAADDAKVISDKEAADNDALKAKEKADEQKGYDDYAKSLADRLSISERYRALNRDAKGDDYKQQLADAAALYAEEQSMLLDQQKSLNELTLMDGNVREAENERINLEMLESNKRFAEASMKIEEAAAAASKKVLEERMNAAINFIGTVQSVFNSISTITNGFLAQQQETLNADAEAEKENINARYQGLLEQEGYGAEELQALLDSANAKKLAGEQLTADEMKAVRQKMGAEIAASEAKFAAQQADLDKKKKEEAHKAAVFNRVLAIAQVPIATAQAILKAIADFGPPPSPLGIAGIAAATAVGGAQMAALIATPIPSAETGGRFVVPHTATGVDSGLLRVNQDEVATITPRGGVSEGGARIIINLDGRPIVDLMNVNLRSGDIYEISPAWA